MFSFVGGDGAIMPLNTGGCEIFVNKTCKGRPKSADRDVTM
jgi:hypothetical protein